MKTIEEALSIAYDECKSNAYFGNGFKKGVEFAQRWIPVEEELPEVGEIVLVKLNNGNVFTAKYVKSAKEERFNAWHNGHSFYQCVNTHWRPINFK